MTNVINYTATGQAIADANPNLAAMTIPELAKLKGISIIPAGQPGSKGYPVDPAYNGSVHDKIVTNWLQPTQAVANQVVNTDWSKLGKNFGVYALLFLLIVVAVFGLIQADKGD
jgi:hypothetical protein